MDGTSEEAALKKKLQNFLAELQRFGSLCGFKHFSCYIRGREELLVSINNTPQTSTASYSVPGSRKQSLFSPTDSFSSSKLPYDKGSLVLSHNTQTGLSGMRQEGIGLPPASPSESEPAPNADVTLFLIAGYARYSCPYVWVRSNHQRLLRISEDADGDKDSPLRLKSIARWKDEDIHVFDIIVELVKLCTYPAPRNPFEVDLDYFRSLTDNHQILASSAMITYLEKILMLTPDSKTYTGKVLEDLQHLAKLHFTSLSNHLRSNPVTGLSTNQDQKQAQVPGRRFPPTPVPTYQPNQAPGSYSPTKNVSNTLPISSAARGCYPGGFERTPAPTLF